MLFEFFVDNKQYFFDGDTLLLHESIPIRNNKSKLFIPTRDRFILDKAIIIISEICNAHCRYCYQIEDEKFKTKGLMTIEAADRFVEYVTEKYKLIEKIEFFGGEPILNFELIEYIVEKLSNRIKVNEYKITTNAVLINKYMINYLIKNKFSIIISCDGPKYIHNYLRKNCSHSKVMKVINEFKNSDIKDNILINCTLTKYHLSQISYDELCDYYENIGLKYCITNVTTDNIEFKLEQDEISKQKEISQTYDNLFASSLNKSTSEYVKPIILSLVQRYPHLSFCHDLEDNRQIVFDIKADRYPCMNLLYCFKVGDECVNNLNRKSNLICSQCWAKLICTDCIGPYIKKEKRPPYEFEECQRKRLYEYSFKKLISYYQNDKHKFSDIITNFYK